MQVGLTTSGLRAPSTIRDARFESWDMKSGGEERNDLTRDVITIFFGYFGVKSFRLEFPKKNSLQIRRKKRRKV